MAHDLGLPVSELRRLAGYGPEAADLLENRMAALNIDMRKAPRLCLELSRIFSGFVQCVKATDSARETLDVIRPTRHGKIIAQTLRC